MAEQLNIQDVNNIFQSIITEFKVLFDIRMKPIVDQIQFHLENYQIISSILKLDIFSNILPLMSSEFQ